MCCFVEIYNSKEYKRSRKAYMAQSSIEYFVSLLVTDAFLAKLLTSIGISDSLTGIISSFTTLAFVIQLMSVFLVKKRTNTKRMVITFDTISILFFMFMYFVPFLPVEKTVKTAMIILSIIVAYGGKYLILSICFKWGNSFVKPTKRAEYSAKKEMLSLFLGMFFTASIGYAVDKYESINNLNGAFLFIAISMFILNICNFICLSLISKEEQEENGEHNKNCKTLSSVIKHTLGNRSFKKVIILTVMWDTARYFTVGFMGVFKTKDLMMSMLFIQVINIIANFARMLISIPFGKFSDKYSFAKGFRVALIIAAIGFFINMFASHGRIWAVIVFTILNSCCNAGTNQNSFNITYNYVDSEYIAEAMAVKNSIGGICGFLASVAGGKILAHIQNNGNMIFGMKIYGQQVLSSISFVFVVIAVFFIKLKIEKENVIVQ